MNFYTSLLIFPLYFFSPVIPCIPTSVITTTTPFPMPPITCTTCTADLVGLVSGNDGDVDSTYTTSRNSVGCATITYTCGRNPVVLSDVVLFTYYNDLAVPNDLGTESGNGSISTTLTCVNGAWEKDGYVINDIECQMII